MAQKLVASLPGEFDLPANFIVQLTAVDPSSGAVVSGVNVSNVAIMAAPITPATADSTGPDYSPLFIPIIESPGGG